MACNLNDSLWLRIPTVQWYLWAERGSAWPPNRIDQSDSGCSSHASPYFSLLGFSSFLYSHAVYFSLPWLLPTPVSNGFLHLVHSHPKPHAHKYFQLIVGWIIPFSSATQSCPTLCDPMDCSMPGLPVHHQLPEFAQTHVHWIGDAIQSPHPLSSPSSAFSLS